MRWGINNPNIVLPIGQETLSRIKFSAISVLEIIYQHKTTQQKEEHTQISMEIKIRLATWSRGSACFAMHRIPSTSESIFSSVSFSLFNNCPERPLRRSRTTSSNTHRRWGGRKEGGGGRAKILTQSLLVRDQVDWQQGFRSCDSPMTQQLQTIHTVMIIT